MTVTGPLTVRKSIHSKMAEMAGEYSFLVSARLNRDIQQRQRPASATAECSSNPSRYKP
ncbi:MAG: hypothetical protein ABSC37_04760 [Xanthobacteraceae bacterium]